MTQNMWSRKAAGLITTLVIGTNSVLLGGASAQAAPAADAASLKGCHTQYVSKPWKTKTLIVGRGKIDGPGCTTGKHTRSIVFLQRHRWWGWDQVSHARNVTKTNTWFHVRFDCAGTGTYSYRTGIQSRDLGGRVHTKFSSSYRTTC